MQELRQLVATLRLAAEVYASADQSMVIDVAGSSSLPEMAQRYMAWVSTIVIAASLSETDEDMAAGDAPLSADLDSWRQQIALEDLVFRLEKELLRLVDAVYFSDALTSLRAVIEQLADDCANTVERLGSRQKAEADSSGLIDEINTRLVDFDLEVPRPSLTGSAGQEADGFPVWFGTNREPVRPADPAAGFSNQRSRTGIHYGRCIVYVPKSHKIGSLGSNILMRILMGSDDRLSIQQVDALEERRFWADLDTRIVGLEEASRHAVVFIHGYNVSFEEAALRAAQLGYDLGISGAMVFFSWPSKARLRAYFADGNSIEASELAIADFLVSIATLASIRKVHVIAHSMGNRGALAAVMRIAAKAERLSGRRFSQFILAAADVDADVFRQDSKAYLDIGERTTLYVSARDKALATSSLISDFARVGYIPPVSIVKGIDTIDVGPIDLDEMGHGYVGNARGVLADIHQLLFHSMPPLTRFGIEERRDEGGGTYFAFRE